MVPTLVKLRIGSDTCVSTHGMYLRWKFVVLCLSACAGLPGRSRHD